MNKKEASNIIMEELSPSNFYSKNGGNVKFANINKAKSVWWLNIHIDERLLDSYHIILNNEIEKKFFYINIPANTLKDSIFKQRFDKTNNKNKLDIEISCESDTFLIDIKSGGTKFDFNPYMIKTFQY